MEFSEEEQIILITIIRNRKAWIGGLKGAVTDRLEESGMIVRWVTDARGHRLKGGPYITLTPWGAEKLGVELRERHWVKWVHLPDHYERVLVEEPYWAQVNRPRRPFVLPHQAQQCGLEYPELVPDPSPGPEYLADEEGKPITLFGSHKARIDYRLIH